MVLWKNGMVIFQNLHTEYDPAMALMGIYPKEVKAGNPTDIFAHHVHSSSIYDTQKVEAIQVSTD